MTPAQPDGWSTPNTRSRGRDGARAALLAAATELLVERAPSAVSGRELADLAGVNYGLIHHYFGTKDAVFLEAAEALRADYIGRRGPVGLIELNTDPDDPFIRAVGRSQLDYPGELGPRDRFPIGEAFVHELTVRVTRESPDLDDGAVRLQAKARALALLSIQLGYVLYQAMLFDTVGVGPGEKADVEAIVRDVYRRMALAGDEPAAPRP
ncbi:MAG: helix-turn-helix domain-containing protein [Acidimicrobiales bacterium]